MTQMPRSVPGAASGGRGGLAADSLARLRSLPNGTVIVSPGDGDMGSQTALPVRGL